jgi:hypothetical protein
MRPAHQLQLGVIPGRPLGSLVLAVADLGRRLVQRLGGVGGLEVELDHLPVALVQVVPVVEDVEHPVLERELSRVARVGGDVRVDGRRLALVEAP